MQVDGGGGKLSSRRFFSGYASRRGEELRSPFSISAGVPAAAEIGWMGDDMQQPMRAASHWDVANITRIRSKTSSYE